MEQEGLTREERIKLEKDIYLDVPDPHVCAENERRWYKGDERDISKFTEPITKASKWIPLGINDSMAAAFLTDHARILRAIASQTELTEFATVWTSTLFRCRYKYQYTQKFNEFRDEINRDPTLKQAAEWIFRNQELLAFRDTLPEKKPEDDKEVGLNKTFLKRAQPDHIVNLGTQVSKNRPKTQKTPKHKVVVATCHYKRDNSWKQHKELTFYSDCPPAGVLWKDKLLVMSEQREQVVLEMFDLTHDTKRFIGVVNLCNYNWNMTMENDKSFAVSDGACILWFHPDDTITTHALDSTECVITALQLKENQLVFGTSTGLVYRVDQQQIKNFGMTHDLSRINSISISAPNIIVQNVNSVNLVMQKNQRSFVQSRILCCGVKGTRIAMLTKYGTVKVHSLLLSNTYLSYVPPKGISCDIDALMPWYHNGIHMSDDGSDLVVLYPNGRIWYMAFKQK